jgi:hypothetical protein
MRKGDLQFAVENALFEVIEDSKAPCVLVVAFFDTFDQFQIRLN